MTAKLATAKKGNVRPQGGFSFVGLLLLLGLAAGIYAAAMFIPVYFDHQSVKEAVRAGLSDAIHRTDDEIIEHIANYVNIGEHSVGTHMEEDPEGGPATEVRGLGLSAANIVVDRNEAKKSISATVDYTRRVVLKPTKNVRVLRFHFSHTEALPL